MTTAATRRAFAPLLLLVCLAAAPAAQAAEGSAVWSLPPFYQPGVALTVTNRALPQDSVFLYTVEMQVPAGWSVGTISHGGSFVAAQNLVRWGLFTDSAARDLTARLTPPLGATNPAVLSGMATFNGSSVVVGGTSTIPPLPPASGTIVRWLPTVFTPGRSFTVTNFLAPHEPVQLVVAQDLVPVGWSVTNISDFGVFDAANRIVKWGPFFNSLSRALAYELTPPLTATNAAVIAGSALFDQVEVTNSGASLLLPAPPPVGTATRSLPVHYRPGTNFTVILALTPDAGVESYAAEERPPTGWAVDQISHAGTVQGDGAVKWPIFPDGAARQLTYRLTPPPDAIGGVHFTGAVVFGSVTVPISGPAFLTNAPVTGGVITRSLPAEYRPGTHYTVRLTISPAAGLLGHGVVETPPAGWSVMNITSGGLLATNGNEIRWLFLDDVGREVSYDVLPPAGATNDASFAGAGDFGGVVIPTGGNTVLSRAPLGDGAVIRIAPAQFVPGLAFTVTNLAAPEPAVLAYAVEESVPVNYTPTSLSHGAVFDPASRKIKWGPFADSQSRSLTYQLIPEANVSGTLLFSGAGNFDGVAKAITGAASTVANRAPTLGEIGPQTTGEDIPVLVSFTVADAETASAQLILSASADNPALLPPGSLLLTNAGGQGMLRLSPAFEQSGTALVTVDVSDGFSHVARQFLLTVIGSNDAPIITSPDRYLVPQDLEFALSGIILRDDDLGTNSLRLSVTAGSGTLRLGTTNGLRLTATATNAFTVEGTLAALNTALSNLTLLPPTNYVGSNFLTLTADDLGSSGPGGVQVTGRTVPIDLFAVDYPPTLTRVDRMVSPGVDQPYVITHAALLAASDAADHENVPLRFVISGLGRGTLTKDGQPVSPGVTSIGSGESVTWQPSLGATGLKTAFSVQASDGNSLSAEPVDVNIQIGPLPQLITFGTLPNAAYGASIALTATASSGLPVQWAVASGPAVITNGILRLTNVGPVAVRASQPGNAFYAPATDVTRSFTATPAPLLVTADDKTRLPGAAFPLLTATYLGLVNADTPATLAVPLVLATTAISNSPPGRYPITAGGTADPRYTITHSNGTLTVQSPAPLLRPVFGQSRLKVEGYAGQTFTLESTPSVLGPWSDLGSAAADPNGTAFFDLALNPAERARFFRVRAFIP